MDTLTAFMNLLGTTKEEEEKFNRFVKRYMRFTKKELQVFAIGLVDKSAIKTMTKRELAENIAEEKVFNKFRK